MAVPSASSEPSPKKSEPSPYEKWSLNIAIIAAAVTFGVILSLNVYLYDNIPANWQIAIIAFVIFLPLAFFLQANLHVQSVRTELEAKIQGQLRRALLKYHNEIAAEHERLEKVKDDNEKRIQDIHRKKEELTMNHKKAYELKERIGKMQDEYKVLRSDRAMELLPRLEEMQKDQERLSAEARNLDSELKYMVDEIKGRENWMRYAEAQIDRKMLAKYSHDRLYVKYVYEILEERAMILTDHAPAEVFGIFKEVTGEFVNKLIRFGYPFDENADLQLSARESDMIKKEFWDLLQFELKPQTLHDIRRKRMRREGLEFDSYLLPLTFFLFTFFSGWLIVLPLINSTFVADPQSIIIPLFSLEKGIPLIVIQWGFLGGLVYTSINLLNRFLRGDLVPRVYFIASVKLLLAAVAAIVLYFFYLLGYQPNNQIASDSSPYWLLLIVFVAGIAPIEILIYIGSIVFSKMPGASKKKIVVGDRRTTEIPGISLTTMFRLNEEGIDSISDLALCIPLNISTRTRFQLEDVLYWKDQAILYMLTSEISLNSNQSLYDILGKKYGIQTWSTFLSFITRLGIADASFRFSRDEGEQAGFRSSRGEGEQDSFFKNLEWTAEKDAKEGKDRIYYLQLLQNLVAAGDIYLIKYPTQADSPLNLKPGQKSI